MSNLVQFSVVEKEASMLHLRRPVAGEIAHETTDVARYLVSLFFFCLKKLVGESRLQKVICEFFVKKESDL